MKLKRYSYETDQMFFVRCRTTNKHKEITLVVDEGYVSCDMCACCYGQKGSLDPVWCQIKSFPVDPEEFDANRKRATSCTSYVPKFMERSMVKTPNVEQWYEKDSMG